METDPSIRLLPKFHLISNIELHNPKNISTFIQTIIMNGNLITGDVDISQQWLYFVSSRKVRNKYVL